jgi:site-specific recombinase XerD
MCPAHSYATLAERYDQGLHYARGKRLPASAPRPLPTCHWPPENIRFLERYRDWLLGGGVSELVINIYHVTMAAHVFGLTLQPYHKLDPDKDLECALEYVQAKQLSASWNKNCRNSLMKFRRFLRLERGLGEETKVTAFDPWQTGAGLPTWLVPELERYQQRNWRAARLDRSIRGFWNKHLTVWRFVCKEHGVVQLADLKRQHVLDFADHHLDSGNTAKGVNGHINYLHGFLLFLQDEGYSIPKSLLSIPRLKEPDSLPRYLTDEQVRLMRQDLEAKVAQATLSNHRRDALLDRAVFYLLWQGGLRLGEVEELRLEDLDFPAKRLSVRNGKGLKDRTVYLTEAVMGALKDFLAVRGKGSGDNVFLYRNAPLKKDLIGSRMRDCGKRVGVHVYPHRLRHTCATQLLNACCHITSIQRFLGHKKLNTTMIYARAHDQTVAEDYFTAMQRVEQRLEIGPTEKETSLEVAKVPDQAQLLTWVEQLALPELCLSERLELTAKLRFALAQVVEV